MNGIAWPDVAIGIFVAFGTLKGLRRGLIAELTGLLALAFAFAAAFVYRGIWDRFFVDSAHVAPAAAHVVGTLAYAAVAYAVVLALGAALATVAKLPLLGIANRALGAAAGFAKSAAIAWAIVYVALFFPLPAAIRHDLRASPLAQLIERPNDAVDERLRASIPSPVRPFGDGLFALHRS